MSQTALTENAPRILDATCGYARIWPAHATDRIDKRPEVKPDLVMDNTRTIYPRATFDEIYYDPSHIIRRSDSTEKWIKRLKEKRIRSGRTSPDFFERYYYWKSREEWLENLTGVNKEFLRILKPQGLLHVKLADTEDRNSVHRSELDSHLTNFYVIKERRTESRSNKGHSTVYWLTMKRAKAEGKE